MPEESQYEISRSYRVHFGRLKKLEGGGGVVFGEEKYLSSQTLKDAKEELKMWLEEYKGEIADEIIQNPKLIEVRWVRNPA
jgi:hypothetical protein